MLNITRHLQIRKERAKPGKPTETATHVPDARAFEEQRALDLAIILRNEAEDLLRTGQLKTAKTNLKQAQNQLDKCRPQMARRSVYTDGIALQQIKLQDVRAEVLSRMGNIPKALSALQQGLEWKERFFEPGSECIIKAMLKVAIGLSYVATENEAEQAFERTLKMAQETQDLTNLSLQVKIHIRYASTLLFGKG